MCQNARSFLYGQHEEDQDSLSHPLKGLNLLSGTGFLVCFHSLVTLSLCVKWIKSGLLFVYI